MREHYNLQLVCTVLSSILSSIHYILMVYLDFFRSHPKVTNTYSHVIRIQSQLIRTADITNSCKQQQQKEKWYRILQDVGQLTDQVCLIWLRHIPQPSQQVLNCSWPWQLFAAFHCWSWLTQTLQTWQQCFCLWDSPLRRQTPYCHLSPEFTRCTVARRLA